VPDPALAGVDLGPLVAKMLGEFFDVFSYIPKLA
jgi:hypothetical protein